jgi:hypothetical protein
MVVVSICAGRAGSRTDAVDGNLMALAYLFGELPPTMPPIMPRFPSIPFPGCSHSIGQRVGSDPTQTRPDPPMDPTI